MSLYYQHLLVLNKAVFVFHLNLQLEERFETDRRAKQKLHPDIVRCYLENQWQYGTQDKIVGDGGSLEQ